MLADVIYNLKMTSLTALDGLTSFLRLQIHVNECDLV